MKKIIIFTIVLIFLSSLVFAQFNGQDLYERTQATDRTNGGGNENTINEDTGNNEVVESESSGLSFGAKFFSMFGLGRGRNANEHSGKLNAGQGFLGETDWGPQNINAESCVDTDGGRNFAVGGVVTGKIGLDSEVRDYPDRCMPSGKILIETYCNKWTGYVQFNKIVCKNGCTNGDNGAECVVPPYCLDIDKTGNKNVKGVVVLFKNTQAVSRGSIAELIASNSIEIIQDICLSETTVKQFSCSSRGDLDISSNEMDCGANQKCVGGVCKTIRQPEQNSQDNLQQNSQESGVNEESFRGLNLFGRKANNPQDESIDIMEGESANINGVQVTFFQEKIEFEQQFSEGSQNLEGDEIEFTDTSRSSPPDLGNTRSNNDNLNEEKETNTVIKSEPKFSSPISISTLKL